MKYCKYYIYLYVLITIPVVINAQNLALHKPYTLSELPNYQYSAPPSDNSSLTDGIYTKGYFWSQRTTVGWMGKKVLITIDLGEIQAISDVTFNTVRSTPAGVSFAKNVYVFISNDNNSFKYVGDAGDTPDNSPGPYEIKKFILKNINFEARYITLAVIPQGKLLFCDEIEVLKGTISNTLSKPHVFSKDSLNDIINSLKSFDFDREYLDKSINKLKGVSNARVTKEYLDLLTQLQNKGLTKFDLDAIGKKIGQLHASTLRNKYKVPFISEKYNPWDTLSQISNSQMSSPSLDYDFVIPKNGVQYGAFVITNTSAIPQQFVFKSSIQNTTVNNIEFFEVAYVPSSDYTQIPDPLIVIKNDINIDPGISQMFIFKITGLRAGSAESHLILQSSSKKVEVNINIQVRDLFMNWAELSANVWGYLNYPMIKDRKREAAEDLELHHINTIVIPPSVLPNIETGNYAIFRSYLQNFKNVKNVFLFMNYSSLDLRNMYKNGQFLSSVWKNKFIEWYNNTIKLIDEMGFPANQVYLYPYDEVGGINIKDFENLILWARKEIPRIKFFATLANVEAINTILPLVQIAQIQSTYKGLLNLPPHQCEIWIYSGSGPARDLSPYLFYRLMAWKAFENDYKGIGFWNYADEGTDKQLNLISDPLLTPSNSYSVIYNGPNKQIISTRRWEAFKLGIEDYALLKKYAEKVGMQKAKALVEDVLNNPSVLNKADSARNEIFLKLIYE